MCKNIFRRKYVHSKFSSVRWSHDMCALQQPMQNSAPDSLLKPICGEDQSVES